METKQKIVKTAKACGIISKVLYILSCVVCLAFIVLAIVLPLTNTIDTVSNGETAVTFATFALYAFVCIGLLWNIEGLFKAIVKEQSPFTERVSHYLKKVAVFVIVLSVVPALIGSTVMQIVNPETETVFPIELGGIIAGVVLFLVGLFFNYGKELQDKDDETL
ncbi:MAG: hypothetical protein J1G02_01040 [Clostridiales bacterium]|nr:hypothetical protein [Clostridiales bacterium]